MEQEREAPKKIALKVPSLFIQGTSSSANQSIPQGSKDVEQTKPKLARPMPASKKKHLEAKKNETESTATAEQFHVENASQSSSIDASEPQIKSNRPMPASARRKLEESVENCETTIESSSSVSASESGSTTKFTNKGLAMPQFAKTKLFNKWFGLSGKTTGPTENNRMPHHAELEKQNSHTPASAKQKTEDVIKSDDNTRSSSNSSVGSDNVSKQIRKPMPASAKRLLECKTDEVKVQRSEKIENEEISHIDNKKAESEAEPKKKINKPMPASARKRIEDAGEDKTKIIHQTLKVEKQINNDDNNKNEEIKIPVESNDNDDGELVGASDSPKETKKINISLGGIKFPTFKKPMPAFAKRKEEEEQTNENMTTAADPPISTNVPADEEKNQQVRSSRRGKSSTQDLIALTDQNFSCEICGQEFYRLSAKTNHEKTHLNENDPNAKKPKSKSIVDGSTNKPKKKMRKESKYKGMKACPQCNKPFKNWRKIQKHVYSCQVPAKYACLHCDKKFKFSKDLDAHTKTHDKKTISDENDMEMVPIPLSIDDEFGEDSVSSPMSVDSKDDDSKSSSKHSVVVKPKPMPKSVKAKLKKDSESGQMSDSEKLEELPKGVQSFKRKIADVLTSLGSKKFSSVQHSTKHKDKFDSPPQKKLKGDTTVSESIRGHPMPASVKKKLQIRGEKEMEKSSPGILKKTSVPPSAPKPKSSELDIMECEVCHKVFSQMYNRVRHEKTVHAIKKPRKGDITSVAVTSENFDASNSINVVDQETKPKFDLSSLPRSGNCPICSKFIHRLSRHIINVHKIKPVNTSIPSSKTAVVRPSAPKSYKIYKSATSKLKQKFALSASKKPVVSLEKIDTSAKTEAKPETKIVASTASSELRCACCDKIFEVSCDFYEHMAMRHSKLKRLITCKLCEHKFSHEEDFLLHMQFKHRNLVDGMKPKKMVKQPEVQILPRKTDPEKQTPTYSERVRRSHTDKSSSSKKTETFNHDINVSTLVSIKITSEDKRRADAAFNKKCSKKSTVTTINSSTRSGRKRAKSPTPEPEQIDEGIDQDSDHQFDDSVSTAMDIDESESEIAITSTFSQKVAPSQKQSGSFDLDPMRCSTCSEVFYSYEALRKHELYFHNVKTTKMCPICGVYPTRLSRHLLAHENKTVRCSCVPCRLSFPEFSQLLKHNLEKHPGVNGGAQSASNKPKDQTDTNTTKSPMNPSNANDTFRCSLCSKEFTGSSSARRHVRRAHPEQEEDAENLVTKVGNDTDTASDKEVEDILKDTNKKLLDPAWDSDGDDNNVNLPPAPPAEVKSNTSSAKSKRPMPASIRAKLQSTKDELSNSSKVETGSAKQISKQNSKPLPASVRAKLEAEKNLKEESKLKENIESKPSNSKPAKPMPASVRAKLDAQNNDTKESALKDSVESKPVKPMPASVRAKLMSSSSSMSECSRDSSTTGGNTSTRSRSKRPMPASMKAKLNAFKQRDSVTVKDTSLETTSVVSDNNYSPLSIDDTTNENIKPNIDSSPPMELITIDDDHVSDSCHDPPPPEPMPPSAPSIPTFSIADEIAEHNKAVEMVMGNNSSVESNFNFFMFQCKLCNEKYETGEQVRRHIRRSHSEFGPEHIENLITNLFDSYTDTPRRRKSNVRYTDDYVENDVEDEVIIPRGTSRRPKQVQVTDTQWTDQSPKTTYVAPKKKMPLNTDQSLSYACKWCGQRKDSPANVKRHICKAHPHLKSQADRGVVMAGLDEGYEEPPPPVPKSGPGNLKAGNPIYVCKICSRCMAVRHSLYIHISRSHPEVKDNIVAYIQELNGNSDNSTVQENVVEEENQDNSFYCSFCPYQSNDEHDYVRHYKEHTGVSPYQCQYCSATFNRKNQLNAHVTREHTGAEFLTHDEAEISMEEVVGPNEISIATSSKVHIDSPRILSLNRRFSSESNENSEIKTTKKNAPGRPGPASRKTAAARKSVPPPPAKKSVDNEISPPNSPVTEEVLDPEPPKFVEDSQKKGPATFSYQGDLSSLFPTLGGGAAPGGIDALDDIDGGMSLD